jgi:hypothetical protein
MEIAMISKAELKSLVDQWKNSNPAEQSKLEAKVCAVVKEAMSVRGENPEVLQQIVKLLDQSSLGDEQKRCIYKTLSGNKQDSARINGCIRSGQTFEEFDEQVTLRFDDGQEVKISLAELKAIRGIFRDFLQSEDGIVNLEMTKNEFEMVRGHYSSTKQSLAFSEIEKLIQKWKSTDPEHVTYRELQTRVVTALDDIRDTESEVREQTLKLLDTMDLHDHQKRLVYQTLLGCSERNKLIDRCLSSGQKFQEFNQFRTVQFADGEQTQISLAELKSIRGFFQGFLHFSGGSKDLHFTDIDGEQFEVLRAAYLDVKALDLADAEIWLELSKLIPRFQLEDLITLPPFPQFETGAQTAAFIADNQLTLTEHQKRYIYRKLLGYGSQEKLIDACIASNQNFEECSHLVTFRFEGDNSSQGGLFNRFKKASVYSEAVPVVELRFIGGDFALMGADSTLDLGITVKQFYAIRSYDPSKYDTPETWAEMDVLLERFNLVEQRKVFPRSPFFGNIEDAIDFAKKNKLATLDLAYRDMDVEDHHLKQVGRLSHVRRLFIDSSDVTDKGLEYLQKLDLRDLVIHGSQVTDKGVSFLTQCKNLVSLVISSSFITDFSFKTIRGFEKLERLVVAGDKITGTGFRELARLDKLTTLGVESRGLKEGCIANLARCQTIEELSLRGSHIKDEWLLQLAGLIKLRELEIIGCTEAGVAALKSMPQFAELNIIRSQNSRRR